MWRNLGMVGSNKTNWFFLNEGGQYKYLQNFTIQILFFS